MAILSIYATKDFIYPFFLIISLFIFMLSMLIPKIDIFHISCEINKVLQTIQQL